MTHTDKDVKRDLAALKDPEKAKAFKRYFKTGPGEYGEGDEFIGVTVPQQRRIAKRFNELDLRSVERLLMSPVHEHRFTALAILSLRYRKSDAISKAKIARFYLRQRRRINNWDLVDASAPGILGDDLLGKDRSVLYRLTRSKSVWDRRLAVLATFAFIRKRQYDDALKIAKMLLSDKHDLMHKAVGWMLREVGNRSRETLLRFLRKHHGRMPRTALRYAIEKFPPERRKAMLGGEF